MRDQVAEMQQMSKLSAIFLEQHFRGEATGDEYAAMQASLLAMRRAGGLNERVVKTNLTIAALINGSPTSNMLTRPCNEA